MIIGIYPGSFDPPTFGHLDIIKRAALVFDHLIVAVAENGLKNPLFSTEERIRMLSACCAGADRIEIAGFNGLLVDFCAARQVRCIVRGVRNGSDLQYEETMARANKVLSPEIETMFMLSAPDLAHVSSTLVREIARCGGDLSAFVPEIVISSLLK
jgi:pantetheine-phosphate adenylyltransferase